MNIRTDLDRERQANIGADRPIPDSAQRQLDHMSYSLCEMMRENLVGIYLHGSLAMGCFNSATSDIDLLVITQAPLGAATRRTLRTTLLATSLQPHPIEISILHYAQISPWRHPAPYDLHFSELYRRQWTKESADLTAPPHSENVDPDLAAHFTVLAARGRALYGAPVGALPLSIPWADYLDALRTDFDWSQIEENAPLLYAVLNACRIWAAVAEQRVLSKAEGAVWALRHAPTQFHALINDSFSLYFDGNIGTTPEPLTLRQAEATGFLQWIRQQVDW
jgi:streptomycin 3"-adenylyltransferase